MQQFGLTASGLHVLNAKFVAVTDLQHVLIHTNITGLGAGKGTGSLDGIREGMGVRKIDAALLVKPVTSAQRGVCFDRGRRKNIE